MLEKPDTNILYILGKGGVNSKGEKRKAPPRITKTPRGKGSKFIKPANIGDFTDRLTDFGRNRVMTSLVYDKITEKNDIKKERISEQRLNLI